MFLDADHLRSLCPADVAEVERVVALFESQWQSGHRPCLSAHLPDVRETEAALRRALLIELVHVDLEIRLKIGEAVCLQEYLDTFPELAADHAVVQGLTETESRCRAAPRIERRLGKYELLAVAGVGGCATVYRGRDIELGRIVAIKVPRREFGFAPEEERFLREARALALLRHPGIVPIYEAGRWDDGCFLVGAFIDGPTLEQRLREGPLPPREAAHLVAQLADAVQHAHAHGIIHRDLKPSNVLLDREGQPHLTDFGLARLLDDATLTPDGARIGTPAYMAPEQARGDIAAVGPRTDVYGLGAVLYHSLVGSPPFRGDPRIVLGLVCEQDPVSPRRLDPGVPLDLERICLKALTKEATDRYTSSAELAEDLRRFLAGASVRARPIGPVRSGWRGCRRRPAITALAAALVLAILTGLSVAGWQWRQAVALAAEAEHRREQANTRLRLSLETVQALADATRDRRLLGTLSRPLRRQLVERSIAAFERLAVEVEDRRDLDTRLLALYGDLIWICSAMEDRDQQKEVVLKALALVESDTDPKRWRWERPHFRSALAAWYQDNGQVDRARAEWQQAVSQLRPLVKEEPANLQFQALLAVDLRMLARLVRQTGPVEEARALLTEAYRVLSGSLRLKPDGGVALLLGWLSVDLAELGDDASRRKASGHFLQARQFILTHMDRPLSEDRDLEIATEYLRLAEITARLGWEGETLRHLDDGIRLARDWKERRDGDLRPRELLALAHARKGRILTNLNRLEEALSAYREEYRLRLLQAREKGAAASTRREVGVALHAIGKTCQRLGRYAEADKAYREALAGREKLKDSQPGNLQYQLDLAATALHAGEVLEQLGSAEEAEKMYRRAVEHQRFIWRHGTQPTRDRLWLEERYRVLARFLDKTGRSKEAMAIRKECAAVLAERSR